VRAAPAGRAVLEVLIAGELDAIYIPPGPCRYHAVKWPDRAAVSGHPRHRAPVFPCHAHVPPQHLIVRRREVWQRNKWIARVLTDAFCGCTEAFAKAQRSFPHVSPWLEAELEEAEALTGAGFHAEGFERNRETIEVFAEQAHLARIVAWATKHSTNE
jgi:4,5-dihydroxyphthalate decarboxylase